MRRAHASMKTLIALLPMALACAAGCSERDKERETHAVHEAPLTVPVPGVTQFALLATRTITMADRTQVNGGHLGIAATATNTLSVGMDGRAGVGEVLLAPRVSLLDRAAVGEIGSDQITAAATATTGPRSAFVAPPAGPAPGPVAAGTTAVVVAAGQTLSLAAGRFGAVTVNGTLNLTGGLYELQSLRLAVGARVSAAARSTVRIATGLTVADRAAILPAAGLRAADLHITASGVVDSANNSVLLGTDDQITAVIVARNAFRGSDRLIAAGAIAAQDVILGADSRVSFDSGFGCGSNASCDDGNPCTTDTCVDAQCTHATVANGTACSDGNACTRTDTCQAGVCTGANPVVCAASDQCHVAGVCSPATGVCSNPIAANGTACSDGNACTQADSCQAGVCTGTNPVVCAPSDQCHLAGVCNPATGACSNPIAANGTACTDGNACTQTDACVAGLCVGGNPVVCAASDQCHVAGACNPANGMCSNPAAPDGTSCSDSNACTSGETCHAGACNGGTTVTCTASDQCHVAGTCNPATGACSNPAAPDGTSCNDNSACTTGETCHAGACNGGTAVTCTASDQCHAAGTCDPATGACSNPAAPDGTSCDDHDVCTQSDSCHAGTCHGGTQTITELAAGVVQPAEIISGPDHNLWYISPESAPGALNGTIVRLTPASGTMTLFPAAGRQLVDITGGFSDDIWYSEHIPAPGGFLPSVGHITTAGVVIGESQGTFADRIAAGTDGRSIWFASAIDEFDNLIGSFDAVSEVTTSIDFLTNVPRHLTAGPDGNMWVTESNGGASPALIGRVSAGGVREFAVTTPGDLGVITGGPDGNLWFTDAGRNEIGRITPAGVVTKYALPTAASGPYGIAAAPDGNLWFTERAANRIGRITPAGQVTELACIPTAGSGPTSIAAGSDGRLWFTETAAGKIGIVLIP